MAAYLAVASLYRVLYLPLSFSLLVKGCKSEKCESQR